MIARQPLSRAQVGSALRSHVENSEHSDNELTPKLNSPLCEALQLIKYAHAILGLLDVRHDIVFSLLANYTDSCVAMATVQSDIFKSTRFGGKYTVTLVPGMDKTNEFVEREAFRASLIHCR